MQTGVEGGEVMNIYRTDFEINNTARVGGGYVKHADEHRNVWRVASRCPRHSTQQWSCKSTFEDDPAPQQNSALQNLPATKTKEGNITLLFRRPQEFVQSPFFDGQQTSDASVTTPTHPTISNATFWGSTMPVVVVCFKIIRTVRVRLLSSVKYTINIASDFPCFVAYQSTEH